MYGKCWVNIRINQFHWTLWNKFPFVSIYRNKHHELDGEFRSITWKWFKIYRFF